MVNFLKRILKRTLEILDGDGKDKEWLEDVGRFFTIYIFPILTFLLIVLLHLYFSQHLKLCRISFIDSFGILQGDYITVMWFFRNLPKLTRTSCMVISLVIYAFMAASYADAMHAESMQEALRMIRLEKEEFIKQIKEYIKKIAEYLKSLGK